MTEREIVEEAIQTAIANGWKSPFGKDVLEAFRLSGVTSPGFHGNRIGWEVLFYNHDFAKSLWGDEYPRGLERGLSYYPRAFKHWEYQLQQMVLEKTPIEYLGEQLDQGNTK